MAVHKLCRRANPSRASDGASTMLISATSKQCKTILGAKQLRVEGVIVSACMVDAPLLARLGCSVRRRIFSSLFSRGLPLSVEGLFQSSDVLRHQLGCLGLHHNAQQQFGARV